MVYEVLNVDYGKALEMALVWVTSAISHHPIMDYGFLCWAAKLDLIYIWHSNPHNPLWDD